MFEFWFFCDFLFYVDEDVVDLVLEECEWVLCFDVCV